MEPNSHNWQTILKVLEWVLFWYWLIPYYFFKKIAFKTSKHKVLWSSIFSVFVIFILIGIMGNSGGNSGGNSDEKAVKTSHKPQVHYVTKKVGQKRLSQAQSQQKVLEKEEAKKQSEYDKLAAALVAAKKKQAKAESSQKAAAAAYSRSVKANADTTYSKRTSRSNNYRGDMNTADSKKIVGNSRSKIYHVPGQSGYRMNSKNAVYFNSEKEAQAAGYRKALR